MNCDLYLKPADLIFVGGNSKFGGIFSYLIKFFTRYRGEEPTKIYHVAGMLSHIEVIEALTTVKKSFYSLWKTKHNIYEIWRLKNIDDFQRIKIANYTYDKYGNIYGAWKLLFHCIDGILGKVCGKDIYFSRKILKMEEYPICSWLWSYAYYKKLGYLFGYDANVVSPDDMYDYVKKSSEWECIYIKNQKV